MYDKLILTVLLLFTTCFSALAQDHYCGHHFSTAPQAVEKAIQHKIAEKRVKQGTSRTTTSLYKIPIIVHVIHNGEDIGEGSNISAEQVYEQIEQLNEDFRAQNEDLSRARDEFESLAGDAHIQFTLATTDPDGNRLAEPGIHRYYSDRRSFQGFDSDIFNIIMPNTIYDPLQYANLWLLNLQELGGFAPLPSIISPSSITHDGMVVGLNSLSGRVVTHEAGHWLGLFHTWGDGCGFDDFVADTPDQQEPTNGSCSQRISTCGSLDMTENYMDYSSCPILFTQGQVERMRTIIEMDERRSQVIQSDVPTIVSAPTSPFNVPVFYYKDDGCNVRFTSQAYIANATDQVSSIRWEFENGFPATSANVSADVSFPPGKHKIQLIMESPIGIDTGTITFTIEEVSLPLIPALTRQALYNWRYNTQDWWITSASFPGGIELDYTSVDNYNNDYTDQDITLQTPAINTQNVRHLRVSFDVAYAIRAGKGDNHHDSLAVLFSDGCQTTTTVWQDGGSSLATAPPQSGEYAPQPSEWESHSFLVELPENSTNATISLTNIGHNGNLLHLKEIRIEEAPLELQLNVGDDQSLCDQESVTLSTSIQDADVYQWMTADQQTVLGDQPMLEVDASGTYHLYVKKGDKEGFETVTLQLNNTPIPDFSYSFNPTNQAIVFSNESTHATSYRWEYGDGRISNELVPPSYFFTRFGPHEVSLTATSICGTATKTITIDRVTALVNQQLSQQVLLFPNPNQGSFQLNVATLPVFKHASIEVVDVVGKSVWKTENDYFREKNFQINFQIKGIYFLKLKLDEQVILKRFVIE